MNLENWDKEIEKDSISGKLDFLIDEAISEKHQSQLKKGNKMDNQEIQKQEISALAIASLTLSCIGIGCGFITTIPGIICGHLAVKRINKNANINGLGLAKAGLIIGYIFLVLQILFIIFIAVIFFSASSDGDMKIESQEMIIEHIEDSSTPIIEK